MDSRIPANLVPLLECYFSAMSQRLPGLLKSFYLVGSIALEEFNPHFSDVDFVAVTNHPATDPEIQVLREVHQEVEMQSPRWKLSGMYVLEGDLGRQADEATSLVGYHDGHLDRHTNFELNPVTWWILKNFGISLLGPDPHVLPLTTDPGRLVAWTRANMNTYWRGWTWQPGRLVLLWTDWGIQWAVLGVLRQFYTIREKSIITKQRAGEYALSVFPHAWHRIINEAIRIRTKSKGSMYRFRLVRAFQAVQFVRYVILNADAFLKTEPGAESVREVESV